MTCDDDEDDPLSQMTLLRNGHLQGEISTYANSVNDWRRMFDEEIACDITIDVDGMLIRAHKSILTSRCQYFAAMFSGKIKDPINIVYLDGFSYECVHFALCQIYSGSVVVPHNIDIFELADLADLLCLEGLKELVTHILEIDYFHKFHKPCAECSFLISKFLPWSGAIGYSEIYYKILYWVKQYSDDIWAKREFALLPDHIIKKCFLHHALDIDLDTVLQVTQCCDNLMYTLPKVTWTINIFRFTLGLLRECLQYIRGHLVEVLSTDAFYSLADSETNSLHRLEDHLTAAIERANPIQVCAAYAQLHRMLRLQCEKAAPEWRHLLSRLTIHCEDALICCASQAMSTSAWISLQPDLQARIQKGSGVMTTSTYSKYMQNVSKYTRERNVEKIKYILYSQLGSINRVPMRISRQPIPAATAIPKQRVVAPGNSMVSSTKITNINLRNGQTQIPVPKANYKNVKSRYMNPKPPKSIPDVVPEVKKAAPRSLSQNDKRIPKLIQPLVLQKKYFDVAKGKTVEGIRKTSIHSSIEQVNNLQTSSIYKQVLNKKVSKSENSIGLQNKIWPPVKEKCSIIAYVSPYSIRALDSSSSSSKLKNECSKLSEKNSRSDKSPTLKNDSNFSSPSRSSHRNSSSVALVSPKVKSNVPTKNAKIAIKHLYSKSTELKATKKITPEPKHKSKIVKNGASNSYSSNDNSINFYLERSRTFVKSEPSVISKEITMDSSIEMYPQ